MNVTMSQDGDPLLIARTYQYEMLRESLSRNIIVAMDTGSGKTQIAVLRISAELDRCLPEQLVWFLCPTIALATQQHGVLSKQLPAFPCLLLSGNDGVERWKSKGIWDAALENIRVVVSTHQVLLDALIHGCITMPCLALLVFDEAHHCVAEHPANRIMKYYYHAERGVLPLPHILGLTASPVMRKRGGAGLETIEANLHAISRSPKMHRADYLKQVHLPVIEQIIYERSEGEIPPLLRKLLMSYSNIDIEWDPYVIKLRKSSLAADSQRLNKVYMTKKTHCREHIKGLVNTALSLNKELGQWASTNYIRSCISRAQGQAQNALVRFTSLADEEKIYLSDFLQKLEPSNVIHVQDISPDQASPKVHQLIKALTNEVDKEFTGIVFVETRASVKLLAQLLSMHPQTKNLFQIGTFVGMSNNSQRKLKLLDLPNDDDQSETLNDLKNGTKNLIISTSVLEEGIDVSACNFVACFQLPPNLKSFIQRRGRARARESKYILMIEEGTAASAETWEDLEHAMKQQYLNDARKLDDIRRQEEEVDEEDRCFSVKSTGAKLMLKDALRHLFHFCNTLPCTQYADLRPLFTFDGSSGEGGFRGTVTLPNTLDSSVREFRGTKTWKTERYAKYDVAFEAYVGLYYAGLVNDNLLPLVELDEANAIHKRPSMVEIREQLNTWTRLASACHSASGLYSHTISFRLGGHLQQQLRLVSSCPLPRITPMTLYVNEHTAIQASIVANGKIELHDAHLGALKDITKLLFSSIYGPKMHATDNDFPLLIGPLLAESDYSSWLPANSGTNTANVLLTAQHNIEDIGLIRDANQTPYVFQRIVQQQQGELEAEPNGDTDMPFLGVRRLLRRRDFLHSATSGQQPKGGSERLSYLAPACCFVDKLPYKYSRYIMFVPPLMHRIEIGMITECLCTGLLASLQIKSRSLVTTAISAPVAREEDNYQRLEFLGDSVLKMLTSIALMADHLTWHEGYLSHNKDALVSNGRLAKAVVETGLDEYILIKEFTGAKWRPSYTRDLLDHREDAVLRRKLSTKVLADVAEALLGAAFLDGGLSTALKFLAIILPEVCWLPLEERHAVLGKAASENSSIIVPIYFKQLEILISHSFVNPIILLEALTHPSHLEPCSTPSYQRLEFLGDSLLDFIITEYTYNHPKATNMPPADMHRIRAALVNGNFLAFMSMDHAINISRNEIRLDDSRSSNFSTSAKTTSLSIWHFLRISASHGIIEAQQTCIQRFEDLKTDIKAAIDHGDSHPWVLLADLQPPKHFSDIIESIIAAIYIDTSGSLAACAAFLGRLRILPYLERALQDNVKMLDPKQGLGIAAGCEKVKYITKHDQDGWNCRVVVGERKIVEFRGGSSSVHAATAAADEAIKVLKGEREPTLWLDDEDGEEASGDEWEVGGTAEAGAVTEYAAQQDSDQEYVSASSDFEMSSDDEDLAQYDERSKRTREEMEADD